MIFFLGGGELGGRIYFLGRWAWFTMQQTQPGPQHFVFYRTVIIIIGLQTTKIKDSKFGVTLVEWRLSYCTVS